MKSVRFDGIYTGKEAEVGHGGGLCPYIYIYICLHDIHTYTYIHTPIDRYRYSYE